MTVIHRPDIADMMAAFVDRWAPGCERSKFAEELKDVVRFEMERCAFAAADACLEQDEAGHPHNQNTWMAACSYMKSKIMSVKPEWMTTPADMPTLLLQATTVDIVDELLSRGLGVDEICRRIGVSGVDDLRDLVGQDAVDRWAALNP